MNLSVQWMSSVSFKVFFIAFVERSKHTRLLEPVQLQPYAIGTIAKL